MFNFNTPRTLNPYKDADRKIRPNRVQTPTMFEPRPLRNYQNESVRFHGTKMGGYDIYGNFTPTRLEGESLRSAMFQMKKDAALAKKQK